jgi:hypothetical protein
MQCFSGAARCKLATAAAARPTRSFSRKSTGVAMAVAQEVRLASLVLHVHCLQQEHYTNVFMQQHLQSAFAAVSLTLVYGHLHCIN